MIDNNEQVKLIDEYEKLHFKQKVICCKNNDETNHNSNELTPNQNEIVIPQITNEFKIVKVFDKLFSN